MQMHIHPVFNNNIVFNLYLNTEVTDVRKIVSSPSSKTWIQIRESGRDLKTETLLIMNTQIVSNGP